MSPRLVGASRWIEEREFPVPSQPAQPSRDRSREAGFTVLELGVAAAIMTIVGIAATLLTIQSQRLTVEIDQQQRVTDAAVQFVNRIADEFRVISPPSILPLVLDDATSCSYQRITAYEAGAPVLGPVTKLAWIADPDEVLNGADDNGDGRIDEGTIVLQEGGQPPITLAGNVLGLELDDVPKGIRITVTIGETNRANELVSRTLEQRITFRNDQ